MLTLPGADQTSVIIRVSEILDNTNAHEMSEAFNAARAAGCTRVILDMSEVCFISSTGVGCILAAVNTFRRLGGDIILTGLQERITRILEVLDLCQYLTVAVDVEAASRICTGGDV